MDRETFFAVVRVSLFGGSLSQSSVSNIQAILDYWGKHFYANPTPQLAYVLATVLAEVGRNMRPVRETFAATDAQARSRLAGKLYGRATPPHGHAYYGRGYVQLTWKRNYEIQEVRMGKPFVAEPDLVLVTENAIDILFDGMFSGAFNGQGHGLAHYVTENKQDFVQARRTVNVLDRALEIAGFAMKFLTALERAETSHQLTTARRGAILADTAVGMAEIDVEAEAEAVCKPSIEHLHAQIIVFAAEAETLANLQSGHERAQASDDGDAVSSALAAATSRSIAAVVVPAHAPAGPLSRLRGSLRIGQPALAGGRRGVVGDDDKRGGKEQLLSQLTRLFPAEAVTIYAGGAGMLRAASIEVWWFALVLALAVAWIRGIATQPQEGGRPQIGAVGVAVISFLIWVVILGDTFFPGLEPTVRARAIAGALAFVWAWIAPTIAAKIDGTTPSL